MRVGSSQWKQKKKTNDNKKVETNGGHIKYLYKLGEGEQVIGEGMRLSFLFLRVCSMGRSQWLLLV